MVVDPHRPEPHQGAGLHGPTDVSGEHRGGQSVVDVVGHGDRGGQVGGGLHGDDRAEHLALDDLGVLVDADDDRRLVVEAVAGSERPAGHRGRSRGDGAVDEALHPVALRGGDDRAELGRLVGGRSDDKAAGGFGDGVDRGVVDAGTGDDAAGGGAVLAGVPVAADLDRLGDDLQVGVVEHHDGGLAAELEVHPLERLRRGAGDRLAGPDRPGERDHLDQRVIDQGGSGLLAAGDDVEHPGREHVSRDLGHQQCAHRGELGGLQHHAVAGGQRRAQLPRRHHERVVPRGDRRDNAERFAAQHRRVALEVLAGPLGLHGPTRAGEEAVAVDRRLDLDADRGDRLAGVAVLDGGQVIGPGLDRVGEAEQGGHALGGGGASPLDERVRGGAAGVVDVVGSRVRRTEHGRPGGRVDDVDRGAGSGRCPPPADEVLVADLDVSHRGDLLR